MDEKKICRQHMMERRDQIAREHVRQCGSLLLHHMMEISDFMKADLIGSFVSFGNEISTRELIDWCLSRGKRVAVPRVEGKEIRFYRISSREELIPGLWGIPEPVPDKKRIEVPGFMVVPGLAFDRKGFRLGYGGGYYDRYLTNHPDLITAGAGYEVQLIDKVPGEPHDLPVDYIVTENNVYQRSV